VPVRRSRAAAESDQAPQLVLPKSRRLSCHLRPSLKNATAKEYALFVDRIRCEPPVAEDFAAAIVLASSKCSDDDAVTDEGTDQSHASSSS